MLPKREVPMEIKDIERELTEAGQSQVCTREELDLTLEELLGEMEETVQEVVRILRGG